MSDTTADYRVTGMTCGHCEMSVREEVEQIVGVEIVDVSAQTGMLRITAADVDDAQILSAVFEAGYSAVRV